MSTAAHIKGLPTFLDLNVLVKTLAQTGPVTSATEILNHSNARNSALRVAQAVTAGTPMVTSSYALDTLYRVLTAPSTDRETGMPAFTAFTSDEATTTVQAVSNLVVASGAVVTTEQARTGYVQAVKSIPAHLQGNQEGQVDFEDLMVVGACLAAVDMLLNLGYDADDARVVLVTADKGLEKAASHLVRQGVLVISTEAYARAFAA